MTFSPTAARPGFAPLLIGLASLEPAVTQAVLLVAGLCLTGLPLRPEAPRCHLGTVTGSAAPGSKSVRAGVGSRLCQVDVR